MRLPVNQAISVLRLLLEGMSVRSVERITEIHRDTICRLLVLAGERCQQIMDEKIKNMVVRDVEVDEIWGFVGKKEGHIRPEEKDAKVGDAYCFIAMERNTKLVLTYELGKRTGATTDYFVAKLSHAVSHDRFQITSDGFYPYKPAVKSFLRGRADFAQLVKVYASPREGEQRYSPGEVVDAVPEKVMGNPDSDRICTSHIERQNLSIRMGMRRMTRLTNAFSKKWENLDAAYALWFAFYNFCRVHSSLKVTPAMESNITDRVWTLEDLISIH
jgi:IS1 family transposase